MKPPPTEGAYRAARDILPMCGIQAVTDWAAEIIDRETTCRTCEHMRRMGITLLDAKWLDPGCHTGCQSLALKARVSELTAALEKADIALRMCAKNMRNPMAHGQLASQYIAPAVDACAAVLPRKEGA